MGVENLPQIVEESFFISCQDGTEEQYLSNIQKDEHVLQKEEKKYCLDDFCQGNILGRGAYGLVHLATEKATGKVVALKSVSMNQILELGKMRHILREKDLLNSLQHTNIIQLISTFKVSQISSIFNSVLYKDEENLYFVFEHAENGTLDDFVKQCKGRPGEDLVKVLMAQLVNFMEYMQQENVMHRDLKPGNIMIDSNYNIKIIDFGDAKKVSDHAEESDKDEFEKPDIPTDIQPQPTYEEIKEHRAKSAIDFDPNENGKDDDDDGFEFES